MLNDRQAISLQMKKALPFDKAPSTRLDKKPNSPGSSYLHSTEEEIGGPERLIVQTVVPYKLIQIVM